MTTQVWWREYHFAIEQTRRWNFAGLELQLKRNAQEWHIETYRHPHQHEDAHDWSISDTNLLLPESSVLQRYIFNQTGDNIKLSPALADRSVVIKPINPLFIPANQAVTLFVSTPVWMRVSTTQATDKPLIDIPIIRPTDTWFGSSPIRGEICYATKVFGRIDLAQLPIRAFRAVTPVYIENHGSQTMPIERINIPTALLPLYSATDGRLWTPTLAIELTNNGRAPKLRIDNRLHSQAGVATLQSTARVANTDNFVGLFDHFFD